ncbi:MAG: hypothetical protein AB1801_02025 [Chloroflexota bacterium]
MLALPTILLILAALSIGATVIATMVAFRSSREAQSALFPIVKEEEANRARRARISIFIWLAVTALLLGGWLASRLTSLPGAALRADTGENRTPITQIVPTLTLELNAPGPSPTLSPTVAPATPLPIATTAEPASATPTNSPPPATATPLPPTATSTPLPPTATATATFSPTPTVTPTATASPTPTPTPTSPADAARVPTVPGRTPAPPGVRMGPIRFGAGMTDDLQLIDPGDVFPAGIEAVYAVYPFKGMEKGLNFSVVWYRNGVELIREDSEWQYGDAANSFSFIVPRGPGLYKLELHVNDTVVATKLFEIR